MNQKLYHVHPQKCIGCKNCELACAFAHQVGGKPTAARIEAFRGHDGTEAQSTVVVCMQCDEAACVQACPAQALWRDPKTGAIFHVPERCIKCRSCVVACPFGNMSWDPLADYPIKCDLCDGDPVCVRFCPTGAISYE